MNKTMYPLNIFYESTCPLCEAEMANLRLRDTLGQLRFTDVCAPDFKVPLAGVSMDELLEIIHAQRADGGVVKGVEVFRLAYAVVGLNWLVALTRLPVMRRIAEHGYRRLAHIRHRVPRVLVDFVFAMVFRRAAQRAADAHCNRQSCLHA